MKTTTKRVVSLLAVLALLMTMFTGMVFNVSAEEIETTTDLVPITDASKWTGKTDKITPNGTFAAIKGEGSERVITTADTYDFGNKLKVSGTLIQRTVSGSQTAKSYVKVGDFKFEIEDDLTSFYVRAVMGEETVYEQSWTRVELDSMQYKHFYKLDFNATIDNTAKTVTLDYLTGNRYAAETVKETGSGTYTGDYSFDGVNCVASFKSNWLADGSNEVVGVLGFSVTKYETVADESSEDASSEDASSEDASSDATSSEDVSSEVVSSEVTSSDATSSEDTSSETVVEKTTTLVPITDASKWTGRTDKITTDGLFASVSAGGEGNERVITSVDTFDFGSKLKVSGTLVQRALSDAFPAKSYVKAGDFRFEIEDDKTTFYVRAVMGEETVYEQSWTRAELGDMKYKHFNKVDFNATIDTATKTVTLDYITANKYADEAQVNTGSGTYTGDYSFDGVNCVVSYQSNWIKPANAGTDIIAGVLDFSVTKYETVTEEPVEVTVTVNAKNGREYTYTTDSYPTIEGMVAADATIKAAIQDVPGYNLTGWTTVDGTAVETNVALTEDITLVPVYTKATATYAVSIDGVVNNYAFNTYVTAVSDNAEFTSWTEAGEVVSYAKEYSFFVGCDRTLISVNEGAAAAQAIVSVNNAWTDGTYDYVLTEWALPEGCTLVAEGVIMTKDASVDLADKTLADVDGTTIRSSSTRLTTAAGQYLIYTNTNANFEAKAYLTYSDGTNQYTIYTDAVTVA